MSKPLTLKAMAERLDTTEKTFRADVRDKGVPFIWVGKRRKFDPDEVIPYLKTTEQPEVSNVVAFPVPKKRRKVVTSKRFAEAR